MDKLKQNERNIARLDLLRASAEYSRVTIRMKRLESKIVRGSLNDIPRALEKLSVLEKNKFDALEKRKEAENRLIGC